MFQSIATLSLSKKLQKNKKRPQNVIAMHAGKGHYSSCVGKHGGRYKKYVFKSKIRLATLGKWATTHRRVFFSGKNCSWTLLPGSI